MPDKKALRELMKPKLAGLSRAERETKSRAIGKKLFALPVLKMARRIAFFVGMPTEVDTLPMIDQALKMNKEVALPRCEEGKTTLALFVIHSIKKDLVEGPWLIQEPDPKKTRPVTPKDIDCIVVPGMAFDDEFHRLGRGLGYYDRLLAKLGPQTMKIGLGFSFQMVKSLPVSAHDVRLDLVLTD